MCDNRAKPWLILTPTRHLALFTRVPTYGTAFITELMGTFHTELMGTFHTELMGTFHTELMGTFHTKPAGRGWKESAGAPAPGQALNQAGKKRRNPLAKKMPKCYLA